MLKQCWGASSALDLPRTPSRTRYVSVGSADNTKGKRMDAGPQVKTLLFFEGIAGQTLVASRYFIATRVLRVTISAGARQIPQSSRPYPI